MIIQKEIIINKGVEDVWKLIGPGFSEIEKWATTISHSRILEKSNNSSMCSIRGCDTVMGSIKEKVLDYSDGQHLVKFNIFQGMPFIIKEVVHTWQVLPSGNLNSKLSMKVDLTLNFLGRIMQPIMKIMMGKMFEDMAKDFKIYAETGKPSASKIKALAKLKQ